MIKTLVLCGCATAALAPMAHASVFVSIVKKGAPSTGSIVASAYRAYVVRLISDQGLITGYDMRSPEYAITGPLLQRWDASQLDGNYDEPTIVSPTQSTTVSPNGGSFDSHFLTPPGGVGEGGFASEIDLDEQVGGATFPPSGSAEYGLPANNADRGFVVSGPSGFIRGAFQLVQAKWADQVDVAYIVLPAGVTINAKISVQIFSTPTPTVLSYTIPEPSALAAISLAGLFAMRRSRC